MILVSLNVLRIPSPSPSRWIPLRNNLSLGIGERVFGGWVRGWHNFVVHGIRRPRGEDRGAFLEAIRKDDRPHDLGGKGAEASVHPLLHAPRGKGRGQGAGGMTWRGVVTRCDGWDGMGLGLPGWDGTRCGGLGRVHGTPWNGTG